MNSAEHDLRNPFCEQFFEEMDNAMLRDAPGAAACVGTMQ